MPMRLVRDDEPTVRVQGIPLGLLDTPVDQWPEKGMNRLLEDFRKTPDDDDDEKYEPQ